MKIALLTRRFDPHGGGTERDLVITADCLRTAGHQIAVYAAEVRALSKDLTVRQLRLPRFSRTATLTRFAYIAPELARRAGADLVLSFARTVGADIIRSGGGAHISYLRAARQWRGRLAAAAMWSSPYHRAQMRIERRGFRHPALRKVIAVSDLVRRDLERQFEISGQKIATIYNGVDTSRFSPASDPAGSERIRRELGIGPAAPLVMFAGNGFARKGLGSILRAWPILRNAASLVVVGSDRALSSYQRLARRLGIADRVRFAGPQPQIADLFRTADVFALPSLFEPFGNVAMEAMACGLPVLVSSRCGVAELIPDAMRGFVVSDPSDPVEIASRLDALINARFDVAKSARAAAERFTWERYAAELLRLVDSVVQPPGG